MRWILFLFFFQAEDGIRDGHVTGVQTCALPILRVEQEGVEVRMRVPWKPATLIIECDRPGIVLLDGRRVGRTGDSIAVQIEGLHATRRTLVRVIPDGDFGVPIERTVELASGETRRERVQL